MRFRGLKNCANKTAQANNYEAPRKQGAYGTVQQCNPRCLLQLSAVSTARVCACAPRCQSHFRVLRENTYEVNSLDMYMPLRYVHHRRQHQQRRREQHNISPSLTAPAFFLPQSLTQNARHGGAPHHGAGLDNVGVPGSKKTDKEKQTRKRRRRSCGA